MLRVLLLLYIGRYINSASHQRQIKEAQINRTRKNIRAPSVAKNQRTDVEKQSLDQPRNKQT